MDVTASTGAFNATGTTAVPYHEETIVTVFKILIMIILAVVTFGMGCAVEREQLLLTLKRPVGVIVGLACQVFLMPLIAYVLIKISSMSKMEAVTFMLVGSCPGGSTSNIITYLVDGDMSLSVSLTTITNILALGTVPLWLLIYNRIEQTDDYLQIPFSSLGISLATLIVPILAGILFRNRWPERAKPLPRILAIIGFFVLLAVAIGMIASNKVPIVFSVRTFMPLAVLPVAGMVTSFLISCLPPLKLPSSARRTIAVEIAIQNGNLSNSVIFLSYSNKIEILSKVITIPVLYSAMQFFYCALLIFTHKAPLWYKRCRAKNAPSKMYQNLSESEMDGDIATTDNL